MRKENKRKRTEASVFKTSFAHGFSRCSQVAQVSSHCIQVRHEATPPTYRWDMRRPPLAALRSGQRNIRKQKQKRIKAERKEEWVEGEKSSWETFIINLQLLVCLLKCSSRRKKEKEKWERCSLKNKTEKVKSRKRKEWSEKSSWETFVISLQSLVILV